MRLILLAVILGALIGCDFREAMGEAGPVASGAAQGALSGAVSGGATGGPWGAVIGAAIGLFAGGAEALRQRGGKAKILGDVTRGVGAFLEESLDPADFRGMTPEAAYERARQDLRDNLANHYTDFTREAVRKVRSS
jgi:hypothetical protein